MYPWGGETPARGHPWGACGWARGLRDAEQGVYIGGQRVLACNHNDSMNMQ